MITIAGIAVAAVKAYVTGQTHKLGIALTAGTTMQRDAGSRDERGAMAIEFLLVISMLIVVFLLMLQYAVKAHAQRIAAAAAERGSPSPRATTGRQPTGSGPRTTTSPSIGPGLASSNVAATRNATSATVTITGKVDQLIPFLAVTVSVHVEGPVEHFVSPPGTGSPVRGTP